MKVFENCKRLCEIKRSNQNISVRFPTPEAASRFSNMCSELKITKSAAINALVEDALKEYEAENNPGA